MAYNEDQLQYIQDQLTSFGPFETKKMFGGIGFFKEGTMFGMIAKDTFRLRVDAQNQPDYETAGMKPYGIAGKKKGMPYWEVPVDVLEDKEQVVIWAQNAYDAALRAKK